MKYEYSNMDEPQKIATRLFVAQSQLSRAWNEHDEE